MPAGGSYFAQSKVPGGSGATRLHGCNVAYATTRNAVYFVTFSGGFIWLSAEGIHGRTSTAIAAEAVAESVLRFFADGMRFPHH